jgi:hypothetical protein
MRRFLWLWLALLGSFWAARALISALLFQRAGHDGRSFLASVLRKVRARLIR